MSNFHKEYMDGLQNKVNFLNQLSSSNQKNTFDYSDKGFTNTFYNSGENGQVGSRPNRPSDYKTESQRIANSQKSVSASNNYINSSSNRIINGGSITNYKQTGLSQYNNSISNSQKTTSNTNNDEPCAQFMHDTASYKCLTSTLMYPYSVQSYFDQQYY